MCSKHSLKKFPHNSVVITVFSIGIFDLSSFLLLVLSVTSQGEISSMLLLFDVLFFKFFAEVPLKAFFLFSLLLITCELLPLLNRDSDLFLLIFLFTEFLFAFEPERLRLEAENEVKIRFYLKCHPSTRNVSLWIITEVLLDE